jgi:hypothetical protein
MADAVTDVLVRAAYHLNHLDEKPSIGTAMTCTGWLFEVEKQLMKKPSGSLRDALVKFRLAGYVGLPHIKVIVCLQERTVLPPISAAWCLVASGAIRV